MLFSTLKHSILARLVGAVTFAVFLGWFVLPSCHCQWDLIFGDQSGQVEEADAAIVLNDASSPGQPCHCDDCPGKTFEATAGADLRGPLQPLVFLPASLCSQTVSDDFSTEVLSRGPPPEFSAPHQSELRTYLRQLSLRL